MDDYYQQQQLTEATGFKRAPAVQNIQITKLKSKDM